MSFEDGRKIDRYREGPYKGFLLIECEECGHVEGYMQHNETFVSRCKECGEDTLLEKLKPVYMVCKCGQTYKYLTNITRKTFTYTCKQCGADVDLMLEAGDRYFITMGQKRTGRDKKGGRRGR